ncbi:MAG: exodeoxyribonuclease VII large subunit [Shimia sp.]
MDLLDDDTPGRNTPEYSVSELSGAVKRTIEGEFGRVRVRGEVGRVFKARGSGHLYYDLKDERNVLSCTTWKGQVAGLAVLPEEGLEVVVTGRMTAFGPQSKYNLNVDEVAVAGQGALMAMLEKRRAKLAGEGLFDAARKRPLPFLPEIVGVVTSPSGAVIRDILHRLRERFPRKVLVWPVAVQGAACAPEVARAIAGFNALTPGGALPRPDVLIVARGGGSIEDLWGFNEEAVVRAAAASEIPLISAVGHETDTTLIDHASDRRAPTPTAAAEIAVPVRADLAAWSAEQGARMARAAAQGLARRGERMRDLSRALPRPETLLDGPRQRLDLMESRLGAALERRVGLARLRLERDGTVSPHALGRGVRDARRRLEERGAALPSALSRRVEAERRLVSGLSTRFAALRLDRQIDRQAADGARLARRLGQLVQEGLTLRRDRLSAAERMRDALGYRATLARGFTVVRAGRTPITRMDGLPAGEPLEIEFVDGKLNVAPLGGGARRAKSSKGSTSGDDQGSLF